MKKLLSLEMRKKKIIETLEFEKRKFEEEKKRTLVK